LDGGTEPDLLDEVTGWQTDDFWEYALFAAMAYIRAAVDRAKVPMREACQADRKCQRHRLLSNT
jgi:hypothetical protein